MSISETPNSESPNKANTFLDFMKITLLFGGCIVGAAVIMRVVGWMVGAA